MHKALLENTLEDEESIEARRPISHTELRELDDIMKATFSIDSKLILSLNEKQIKHLLKYSNMKFCSHEFFNKMLRNPDFMN